MRKRTFYQSILLLLLVALVMPSCFRFRMTDHQKLRKLRQQGVEKVENGIILSGGQPIHYTKTGKDSGRPLIFVHGSPGSSSQFLPYHHDSALIANFCIYSIDRPGYGFSGFGRGQKSLEDQATTLNNWLDSMGIQNAILVGHSYGGPTIVKMAMLGSVRVAGLVVVSGSVSAYLEPKEAWRQWLSKGVVNWWMPKTLKVSNREILELKEHLAKMSTQWNSISVPVNIVHGGEDNLVPVENAEYMEQKLTESSRVKKFIYPNENHFIPFTRPEILKNAIFDLHRHLAVVTINED